MHLVPSAEIPEIVWHQRRVDPLEVLEDEVLQEGAAKQPDAALDDIPVSHSSTKFSS